MSVGALIVAAGGGVRAGGEIPKQFRLLLGRSVLSWSVRALSEAGAEKIVVAIGADQADFARAALANTPTATIVEGGATRTASVRAGLTALVDADVVLIHDAARPGLTPRMVRTLVAAIEAGADGAAPALPVVDSLRRTDGAGHIIGEVERAELAAVQTPQAFRGAMLRAAYAVAPVGASFTDDLAVVRAHGGRTIIIPGEPRLMKLTYAEDFSMLEHLLGGARTPCVGTGFDAHRFGDGGHVMLCGVRVPHGRGVIGHSDADVGWHALVDAILGALGAGDIGTHFPPSDPQWKGANSETFLRHAAQLAQQADAQIMHVDITLICEAPKVGPHREAMRARTSEVLALPLSRVSVKATTTERMGFAGREEGLAAQAVATLLRPA
ncbi:MAG: bifunctional 2-C-methyl-D-erythritol 4-phosphate cytidylyltransferase/2-C-methyl-D-erythritol 2,4-cyclodiphosphate synthase [Terricaulis sp.]